MKIHTVINFQLQLNNKIDLVKNWFLDHHFIFFLLFLKSSVFFNNLSLKIPRYNFFSRKYTLKIKIETFFLLQEAMININKTYHYKTYTFIAI